MSYKLQPGSPRDYRYDFMSWLNYAHRETAVSTEWCWSTSESLNLGNQARSQSSVFLPLPLHFSLFPFFHLHSLHRWLTCDRTAPTSPFLVLCPTEAQIAVSQSSLFHTQTHTQIPSLPSCLCTWSSSCHHCGNWHTAGCVAITWFICLWRRERNGHKSKTERWLGTRVKIWKCVCTEYR